jgi:CRISPR-associated protein Cmr4
MFIDSKLFIYRAISPLHCGAAEGSGGIDLPVARERTTGHPIIPASSLKGVWRDYCESLWSKEGKREEVEIAFGPDPEAGDADKKRFYAGCLGFTDAQILFLPVRASSGTFAMITCPLQVRRYIEFRRLSGLTDEKDADMEVHGPAENTFSPLSKDHPFSRNGALIFLEDEELGINTVASDKWIAGLPSDSDIPERLRKRRALVSDEVFRWFCRNGLEVVAHNILKEGKQSDNLWYEEVVPSDSIFFSLVLTSPPHQSGEEKTNDNGKYLNKLASTTSTKIPFFQVGGHETTGRGLMEVTSLNNKKATAKTGSEEEEEADDQ